MRIEELVVEHLDWLQNSGRAIGTIKNRQCQLNRFLEFIGPAMVSDITRIRLEDYYGWLKQCHSRGENGGVEAMSHLKAALKWAQEMDLCDFAYGRFPPISRVAPPTKRISDDDLPRLLAAADPDFKDMLLFGLMTGLRPKEQRELQRCHCQKDATGSYYVIIQRHKTSRSAKVPTPRSVPLAPAAEEILRRQLDNHSKSQFVFLNASGTPYRQYGYRQRLERLCDRAKTQHYSPYSLRHSFASLQSESGVETRKHALRTEPRTH
jgi:integrase